MKAKTRLAIISAIAAFGFITTPAYARTIFDDIATTAPRTVFDDIATTAPRSVFDDIATTAPVRARDRHDDVIAGE